MAIRLLQKNGSDISATDDSMVNFALFGTCIFKGIGDGRKASIQAQAGGSYKISVSTGMGCFGGRIVYVDEPVSNTSMVSGTSVFLVIDLSKAGSENIYFTNALRLSQHDTMIEADENTFVEEGKKYAFTLSEVPSRNSGESVSCRRLAQSGKLGDTLLSDIFDFDSDGKITDFKSVSHCKSADYAMGFATPNGTQYEIGDGLTANGWGILVSKTITTTGSFTGSQISSNTSVAIENDPASYSFTTTAEAVSSDEFTPVFVSVNGKEGGIRADAQGILGSGVYIADNLQRKLSSSSDKKAVVYYRWTGKATARTDCTITVTGTYR